MKAPAKGDACPDCTKGAIRHHTAPGGAAHRFCPRCHAVWPLPNRIQRRRRSDVLVMVAHAGFLGGAR